MFSESFLVKACALVVLFGISVWIGIVIESSPRTRPDAATQLDRMSVA